MHTLSTILCDAFSSQSIQLMPYFVETKNKPITDHLSEYESCRGHHHMYYSEEIVDCHFLDTFKENNKKTQKETA